MGFLVSIMVIFVLCFGYFSWSEILKILILMLKKNVELIVNIVGIV